LFLTEADKWHRFSRAKGLGRVLAIATVLSASATWAWLLALFD
jgi:hypothetical protein